MSVTVTPAIERLWAEIDRQEDQIVQTVADLVEHPSPLGEEAAVQGYVADHLRQSGPEVDV